MGEEKKKRSRIDGLDEEKYKKISGHVFSSFVQVLF